MIPDKKMFIKEIVYHSVRLLHFSYCFLSRFDSISSEAIVDVGGTNCLLFNTGFLFYKEP